MSGDFPNEEAIFDGAVKIADLTERASYLQKACGDDETLRARLDALLASHEDPGSFLAGPVPEADGLIGKALAHYEITEKLGQGGMGEVFRARDTKLGREVAIKVLPPMLARQPDRVARFRREAKLLAALNHPNIGAIYGFEEVGDKRFLVLELVEGETLSARLAAGPLPIDEALNIGKQIAEALEAAHDRGIIHRDLKPANVVVRTDGTVKVLDFGMAKPIVESGSGATIDPSTLSTIRRNVSQPGMILGTAAYMSPEQARGRALDKRSDIFSFGCVLFELLTADSLFGGETVSDTIGAVLHKEPNWNLVPPKTPPSVQHLLRRCLAKDRNRRLRDIGDARLEIEAALGDLSGTSGGYSAVPSARRRSFAVVGAAIFGIIAGLVVGGILRRPGGAPPRRDATTPGVTRFTYIPPAPELVLVEDWFRPSLAVSPDGRHVAYVVEKAGQTHLRLRALDQFESRIMPQTQGAKEPFFSEDGAWLAFFTNTHLKKISLQTHEIVTICEALSAATGGCWDSPQTILFSGRPAEGLVRVSADGGTPQPVTTPDRANGQFGHMYPRRLHGRRAVLALIRMNDPSQNRIAVFDLDTNDVHPLSVRAVNAQFDPSSGFLVYGQSGTLLAVPFDTDTLAVTGTPILLTDRVFSDYVPLYSVSSEGTLVYVPGAGQARDELVWVDEQGTVESLGLGPESYDDCPRLSPDGRWLAIGSSIGSRWMMDVWIHDLHRDAAPTRITFNPDADGNMLWAPDGQSLVFSSMRAAPPNLYRRVLRRAARSEELLLDRESAQAAMSFLPDGKFLVFGEMNSTNFDLLVLPVEGEHDPIPLFQSPFNETAATFSPDGRWLAYQSDESGRYEVYVHEFSVDADSTPKLGRRWTASSRGGTEPRWSRSTDELTLYYRNGAKMMAVAWKLEPDPRPGEPRLLFEGIFVKNHLMAAYDIGVDGRFLMIRRGDGESPNRIRVVRNWSQELPEHGRNQK